MSEMQFNFANHVPASDVYELGASYNGRSITTHLEILRAGTYVVVGGKVGTRNSNGCDTFVEGTVAIQTIAGPVGKRVQLQLETKISSGFWAVGIFNALDDIPYSTNPRENREANAEWGEFSVEAWTLGFLICAIVGVIVISLCSSNESPAPTYATDSGKPYDMPQEQWDYVNRRIQNERPRDNRLDVEEASRAIWEFEKQRKAREGR